MEKHIHISQQENGNSWIEKLKMYFCLADKIQGIVWHEAPGMA